jgi:hypothetical protein
MLPNKISMMRESMVFVSTLESTLLLPPEPLSGGNTRPPFRRPDRRGRKGRSEDLLPTDRVRSAREIWADPEACAKTDAGVWMLREAAKALGPPDEAVDDVLRRG